MYTFGDTEKGKLGRPASGTFEVTKFVESDETTEIQEGVKIGHVSNITKYNGTSLLWTVDTIGTGHSVLVKEMSSFQRYWYFGTLKLYWDSINCPDYRGVPYLRFLCPGGSSVLIREVPLS